MSIAAILRVANEPPRLTLPCSDSALRLNGTRVEPYALVRFSLLCSFLAAPDKSAIVGGGKRLRDFLELSFLKATHYKSNVARYFKGNHMEAVLGRSVGQMNCILSGVPIQLVDRHGR